MGEPIEMVLDSIVDGDGGLSFEPDLVLFNFPQPPLNPLPFLDGFFDAVARVSSVYSITRGFRMDMYRIIFS